MTRGKHGQAAQAKADAAAQWRIRALEAELATERAAHTATRHELTTEAQNLRGALSRQVRELSSQAILESQEQAKVEIELAKADLNHRMREAMKFIFAFVRVDDVSIDMVLGESPGRAWDRLAWITGIPVGELMAISPTIAATRKTKRMRTPALSKTDPIVKHRPANK